MRRQAEELAEAERRLAERERHLADQQAAIRGERAVVEALCDRAGLDPAAIRRQATSGPPAPAQSTSSFWAKFPDHDPRYLSGAMTLDQVTAEYAQRQR